MSSTINITPLNGTNYSIWRSKVRAVLADKERLNYLTEDSVVQGVNEADENAVNQWKKNDAKATSIIIITLGDEASMSVLDDNLPQKKCGQS